MSGQHLPLDLCSVLLLPSQTRRWSFLAQALGLMVDLDIGTENMRWMGDTRFMVGFLKGLAANKNFKCRLRMKVVESDKVEMARAARDIARVSRRKKVVGQGTDPLANGVKRLTVNGHSSGDHGETLASVNGTTTDGDFNGNEGPLPDAKPLEPNESWTTIETGKKAAVKIKSQSEPADMGAAGGWVDGEGMLYA